jgi:hypothetical protein
MAKNYKPEVVASTMADPKIITSPLADSYSEGGLTVDVQIYRADDSKWTLEVVGWLRPVAPFSGEPTIVTDRFPGLLVRRLTFY